MGADESKRLPTSLTWIVHCPRHGERAQLHIGGLESNPPDLVRCSLRPDDLPPGCDQACMGALNVHPEQGDETDEAPIES